MCSAGQRVMGRGHPSCGTCEPFCVTAATKHGMPAFLSRRLVLILLPLGQTSRSSPDPGLTLFCCWTMYMWTYRCTCTHLNTHISRLCRWLAWNPFLSSHSLHKVFKSSSPRTLHVTHCPCSPTPSTGGTRLPSPASSFLLPQVSGVKVNPGQDVKVKGWRTFTHTRSHNEYMRTGCVYRGLGNCKLGSTPWPPGEGEP